MQRKKSGEDLREKVQAAISENFANIFGGNSSNNTLIGIDGLDGAVGISVNGTDGLDAAGVDSSDCIVNYTGVEADGSDEVSAGLAVGEGSPGSEGVDASQAGASGAKGVDLGRAGSDGVAGPSNPNEVDEAD